MSGVLRVQAVLSTSYLHKPYVGVLYNKDPTI